MIVWLCYVSEIRSDLGPGEGFWEVLGRGIPFNFHLARTQGLPCHQLANRDQITSIWCRSCSSVPAINSYYIYIFTFCFNYFLWCIMSLKIVFHHWKSFIFFLPHFMQVEHSPLPDFNFSSWQCEMSVHFYRFVTKKFITFFIKSWKCNENVLKFDSWKSAGTLVNIFMNVTYSHRILN